MAVFAFISECAIVLVILAVATGTADSQDHFIAGRSFVTSSTADVLVLPFQLEQGLVMIEIPALPIARVMTIPAVRPQCALMNVLFFVT